MGKGSTGRVEMGIDIDFKGIIELLNPGERRCARKVLDTAHPGKFLGRRSDTSR